MTDDSPAQTNRAAFSDRIAIQARFSESSEQGLEYRSISRLAMFSLLLGLVCPLALVHPLAWAIPCITIPISWAALRRISHPQAMLTGKTAAVLGMLIAVLFLAWAPVRHIIHIQLYTNQAKQFSDTWLELVRENHIQEAHRWMLPFHRRMSEMTTQQFYETNVDLQEDLKSEFTEEPANLLASQSNSSIRFLGVEAMQKIPSTGGTTFLLKYVLERLEDDLEDVEFIVRVRQETEDGVKHWQIADIYKPI